MSLGEPTIRGTECRNSYNTGGKEEISLHTITHLHPRWGLRTADLSLPSAHSSLLFQWTLASACLPFLELLRMCPSTGPRSSRLEDYHLGRVKKTNKQASPKSPSLKGNPSSPPHPTPRSGTGTQGVGTTVCKLVFHGTS